MKFFESVGRIPGSASPVDRWRRRRGFLDDRHELLFCLLMPLTHQLSSHEHSLLSSDQVDRPLRGRCYLGAEGAFLLGIELATGRVRPSADKGLLDPPCPPAREWHNSRNAVAPEGWS